MHDIMNESDYGPHGKREALWNGKLGIDNGDDTLEWIHRVRMPFCHIVYREGMNAESANGPWDTVIIAARTPMRSYEVVFQRTDQDRERFFATLSLLEDAYESGQREKTREVRECLGIKGSL